MVSPLSEGHVGLSAEEALDGAFAGTNTFNDQPESTMRTHAPYVTAPRPSTLNFEESIEHWMLS